MSIVETTVQINARTVSNMKRSKLEDYLLLFADKSVKEEAQIAQLTAEAERLQRVVEQAIELGMIHADHFGIYSMAKAREVDTYPDLYAQLKGADRR
jgi:hypothetical protein